VPSLDQIWEFHKTKNINFSNSNFFLTDFNQIKKKNKFSNFEGYMILENIMKNQLYSILDMKLELTEEYKRYLNYSHPHKLISYKEKFYLNIQGINLVNAQDTQYYYIKNLIKYKSLVIQKQIIRKIFYHPEDENKMDIKAIKEARDRAAQIYKYLNEYEINLMGSSVLIFYNQKLRLSKVYLVDFSYFPHKLNECDLLGLELLIKMLDEFLTS
jgi:hypothetical protein